MMMDDEGEEIGSEKSTRKRVLQNLMRQMMSGAAKPLLTVKVIAGEGDPAKESVGEEGAEMAGMDARLVELIRKKKIEEGIY